jgi:P27 family predicted phage terminase small subunit
MPVGRKPKPTALKVLQGNPGQRPINLHEPQPAQIDELKAPRWLDAMARECWRRNAPELVRCGILTVSDIDEFGVYCQAWSRYRKAVKALAAAAAEDYRNACVTVEKAETALRLLGSDFGMNPSARSRLSVAKPTEKVDAMEDMLSGRSRAS